jgi:hypothetical protein
MPRPAPVTRTRGHVEREYGREKWPAVERLIQEEKEAEPDAGLPHMLGRVVRAQHRTANRLEPAPFVLDGELARIPASGAFGATQFVIQDLLAEVCTPATDLIVELGSGWGWHILSTWVCGGPRAATYVAAEYTAAGRRAAASLAELDERLDFRAIYFDYHEPGLEGLGRRAHAVVFTAHSIEQIPYVEPGLFEVISGAAQRVTCLHFEPVGWQVEGHDGRGSSREYAERHDYNRNLVAALRNAESANRLTVDLVQPDVFGINPQNSTTIIRWRSPAEL